MRHEKAKCYLPYAHKKKKKKAAPIKILFSQRKLTPGPQGKRHSPMNKNQIRSQKAFVSMRYALCNHSPRMETTAMMSVTTLMILVATLSYQ